MESLNDRITSVISKLDKGFEFECSFNRHDQSGQVPLHRFNFLLRRALRSGLEYQSDETLDVSYSVSRGNDVVRLTVKGAAAVDSIVRTFSSTSSESLVSILVGRVLSGDDSKSSSDVPPTPDAIFKEKERFRSDIIEDPEFGLRYRLATESVPTKEQLRKLLVPSDLNGRNVTFRYKHRVSFVLFKDKTCIISLDLTSVRQASTLRSVSRNLPLYEVELDMTVLSRPSAQSIKAFTDSIPRILGWFQSSSLLTGRSDRERIIGGYESMLKTDRFYQMKPVSLNGERFLNALPHNYAVTDKADGETCCLFIYDGDTYLLNNNLEIVKKRFLHGGGKSTLGTTLVEGELVVDDQDRHYLLLYDCLLFDGEDVRSRDLLHRLQLLDRVLDVVGSASDAKSFPSSPSDFGAYLGSLFPSKNEKDFYITKKMYLFPKGVSKSEIYGMAEQLWMAMKGLPYKRDGLIFTGIEQPYTMDSREVRFPILKWKPPELNSIDLYVEFLKKRDGSVELLFDRTSGASPSDRPFVTLRLFVGRRRGGREFPVPFMEKEGKSTAFLFVSEKDPIPRDVEGHPIEDGSVLEMVYDPLASGPSEYRWKVLRSRHDKSLNVRYHKRQYGNNEDVSMKIWETVLNPIRMDDFHGMVTNTNEYTSSLRQRFTIRAEFEETKGNEEAYYQFQTEAGKPMRRFHNLIKDTLISYFSPRKEIGSAGAKKLSVLDIGVGRGGDIYKMWHARVKELVGTDTDGNGLFTSADCARNRYREAVNRHPGFPSMVFIQADASIPFNQVEQQASRLPSMTAENKNMLKKYLGGHKSRFQGINAQFMVHYLFTEHGLSGLCQNISKQLSEDGVMVVTTFNAERVRSFLEGKKEKTVTYTDATGEEKPLFIIRDISIDPDGRPGLEQAMDVHVSLYMNEETFYTEYLVYPETIIREFRERAGLWLIDRCSFSFFRELSQQYSGERYFDKQNGVDEASRQLSDLYEVYIFQKKTIT